MADGTARWTGRFAGPSYRTITDVKVGDFATGMRKVEKSYANGIVDQSPTIPPAHPRARPPQP